MSCIIRSADLIGEGDASVGIETPSIRVDGLNVDLGCFDPDDHVSVINDLIAALGRLGEIAFGDPPRVIIEHEGALPDGLIDNLYMGRDPLVGWALLGWPAVDSLKTLADV